MLAVQDSAADIENGLGGIVSSGSVVSSITATSGGPVTLSVGDLQEYYPSALDYILNNISGGFAVADTAANLSTEGNLDFLLQGVPNLKSITQTDPANPMTLSVSPGQASELSLFTRVSGSNVVFMTGSGTADFSGVSAFATIVLYKYGNTVTLGDATLSGGALTIDGGGMGGNTVNATADTAASEGKTLTYGTGAGADTFTGGFESDVVEVPAYAVGGDILTGGTGADTLILTSPGGADLSGVSNFGTIDLSSGGNAVTLGDTTLSGGAVAINDGGGNNSVNASADTAASNDKTLTYVAGAGADTFTGGFENDVVEVAAAAVGGDTFTGGGGAAGSAISAR